MDGFQVPEWQENTSSDGSVSDASVSVDTSSNINREKNTPDALGETTIEKCETTALLSDNPKDASLDQVVDDKYDSTLMLLKEINGKIDQMNQLFVQKIQHTTHEEKIVDQMHAELQKYKDDMYAQLVRPILLDIIEIRESIRRVSSSYALKPEEERVVPLKTFSDYTYDIQDVLEKNNIVIYDSREGDIFNALKHRAVKKVTTPVEDLHGKIAESLSSGYEYLGKTISPEKVVVYIYQESENTEGEN